MRLYLIRHGETEGNARRVMQGYGEVPLNDRGIEQAARLGRRMAKMPVDRIVASDLRRAAMTACIIAAHTGTPIVWDSGFYERDPGALTGLSFDDAMPFFTDPDFVPPEGESIPAFTGRVEKAFAALLEDEANRGKNVAVVSHGMVCGAFMRVCLGKSLEETIGLQWPNTSLTIADFNGAWELVSQGDASHLEGMDPPAHDPAGA